MSTLSSTSRSGPEIRCFDILRSKWLFQTIFNHFLTPFILFYNTVWAKQTFVLLFFEGWTARAIFFLQEFLWTLSCVCGWQQQEKIHQYKCLCFPSKLLSHYTYSEELFDLKKREIRWVYFPYKPRRVNKGHCIASSKRVDCVFGWQCRVKSRDCLCFPSRLLNHNNYSERLFNLNKVKFDEFSTLRNLCVSNRAV